MEMSEEERMMLERLERRIVEKGVSNAFLVQLIELCGRYLGLLTISAYAKRHKLSYNGVKKGRHPLRILGIRFVVDND